MSKTIKKTKDGRATLYIDGVLSACPFKTSQMVQDSYGRQGFVNQPCDSSCPHFNLKQGLEHGVGFLRLFCAGDNIGNPEEVSIEEDSPKPTLLN
jgi:hypothetical protein